MCFHSQTILLCTCWVCCPQNIPDRESQTVKKLLTRTKQNKKRGEERERNWSDWHATVLSARSLFSSVLQAALTAL